ncbi:MAG: hypothetical protein K2J35_03205, partial [Eubacterium sp.]|nr:hypothetical protein [Eubacterium sp.]
MDEKEKVFGDNQIPDNGADNEKDSFEEKDGVKYETNDNWEFEAEAPTLNDDMFAMTDYLLSKSGQENSDSQINMGEYISAEQTTEEKPKKNMKLVKIITLSVFAVIIVAIATVFTV